MFSWKICKVFKKQLYWRIYANDCFWKLPNLDILISDFIRILSYLGSIILWIFHWIPCDIKNIINVILVKIYWISDSIKSFVNIVRQVCLVFLKLFWSCICFKKPNWTIGIWKPVYCNKFLINVFFRISTIANILISKSDYSVKVNLQEKKINTTKLALLKLTFLSLEVQTKWLISI